MKDMPKVLYFGLMKFGCNLNHPLILLSNSFYGVPKSMLGFSSSSVESFVLVINYNQSVTITN